MSDPTWWEKASGAIAPSAVAKSRCDICGREPDDTFGAIPVVPMSIEVTLGKRVGETFEEDRLVDWSGNVCVTCREVGYCTAVQFHTMQRERAPKETLPIATVRGSWWTRWRARWIRRLEVRW